jgi:hypothetical protein
MLSKMKINHVSSAGGSNSTGEREGGKEKGTQRERESTLSLFKAMV